MQLCPCCRSPPCCALRCAWCWKSSRRRRRWVEATGTTKRPPWRTIKRGCLTKNWVFNHPKLRSIPMKNGKTDQTLVDISESMWIWPSKNCDQSQIWRRWFYSALISLGSHGGYLGAKGQLLQLLVLANTTGEQLVYYTCSGKTMLYTIV